MSKHSFAEQRTIWAVIAILVAAVALGGGGSKYGLSNLVVQIIALVALGFHREAFFTFWRGASWPLRILIGATILLPTIQLVPLPMSFWSGLPGRELVVRSFELSGSSGWATMSVEPVRTLLALTALITPLALLTIGWRAPREGLILAGWTVVALGLANFLLGVPQVLSNSETGVLYPENPMPGVLFGTFANRNTTGVFLVGALALATMLPAPYRLARMALPLKIGIGLMLVLAIVLTRSRTALVLSLLPLGLIALRILLGRISGGNGTRKPGWQIVASGAIAVALVASLVVFAPGRIGDVADRFTRAGEDSRAYIWDDALYSADRYWPVGSGMGTFDDVFQVDESLENMTPKKAGRAHNDYIEVAIEAGAVGIALIIAWLALLAWLVWRARLSEDRWIAWSGGIVLLAIAMQSVTDYPLRNQTMLAVGAFALLLLCRFGISRNEEAS